MRLFQSTAPLVIEKRKMPAAISLENRQIYAPLLRANIFRFWYQNTYYFYHSLIIENIKIRGDLLTTKGL